MTKNEQVRHTIREIVWKPKWYKNKICTQFCPQDRHKNKQKTNLIAHCVLIEIITQKKLITIFSEKFKMSCFVLSKYCLFPVLCDWIESKDLTRFDSSVTNKVLRPNLWDYFESPQFVLGTHQSHLKNSSGWFVNRKIKLRCLWYYAETVKERYYAENVKLKSKFKVLYCLWE